MPQIIDLTPTFRIFGCYKSKIKMKRPLLLLSCLTALTATAQTVTFTYTGDLDSLVIPNCVDSVIINAWGAEGGSTTFGGIAGKGAFVSAKMAVTPGDVIYVYVGGQDGYNGGGAGGLGVASDGVTDYAGHGGGASDVRVGGTNLDDRMLVAGGGGGAGRHYWNGTCMPCGMGGDGGFAGVTQGQDGSLAIDTGYGSNPGGNGKGGTQSSGGAAGAGTEGNPGAAGVLGVGGNGGDGSFSVSGGGGGGGYYGGGGGASSSLGGSGVGGAGGGGGSSFYHPVNMVYINGSDGVRSGNGQVTITYILSAPIMTLAVGQVDITLNALQDGVSYQWLNCGTGYSNVAGATGQSFTATANGSYAVELDNGNGCIDTSACFTISEVGVEEYSITDFSLYPNPASENITISIENFSTELAVQILDANGRIVLETVQNAPIMTLNLESLESGVYMVLMTTEDAVIARKTFVLEQQLIIDKKT